jgi:ribosomal protein S18 acetylase RimI-like enzyme
MQSTLVAPPLTETLAAHDRPDIRYVALDECVDRDAVLRFCHALARENMAHYLAARGRMHDAAQWFENSKTAIFHIIEHAQNRVGFVSTVANRYSTPSLHIGDLQIEQRSRNLGFASAAIQWIATMARRSGCANLTLNVFHDNPAAALYRRHGFEQIHFDGDKIRMRKFL